MTRRAMEMAKEEEKLKLLGFWASLFVLRVQWALKLKGVEDYEYVEEDIWGGKSSLLLTSNPVYKKVPVLIHNGKPIIDSILILEYIDEKWVEGPPIMPRDPYQRAKARFWAKFSDEKVVEVAYKVMYSSGETQVNAANSVVESLEFLEQELEGKKFFGGESIGYLDIVLGWVSYMLEALEEVGGMKIIDANKFPCLTTWMKSFADLPPIKESLPPRDKMVLYFVECRQIFANLHS